MPSLIAPWQRLVRLLRVDRKEIGHIYLYALVGGAIGLSVPLGVQAIINLISGGQLATSWGVLIAFVTIGVGFTGGLQVMQLTLSEKIQQRLLARSALEFAYRVPRIPTEAYAGRYLPELMNRFFETFSVQKGLGKLLLDIPLALLQIAVCLLLLAIYHPFFIAFGLLLVGLLYLLFRYTGREGLATSMTESNYKFEVAHWLEEVARAQGTFRGAGGTELPMERTDRLVEGYVKARRAHFKVLLAQYSGMVVFKVIVTLSLLLIGGVLVMDERMNLGQFVAAEIVVLLLMSAVEKLILSIESVYDVLTALEKIGYVTDLPIEPREGLRVLAEDPHKGMDARLTNVGFNSPWDHAAVLHGVDLHLLPGEKVCLSGPSGAGKTTLLRILSGDVRPHEGNVQLDGHPLNSLDLQHVRSLIGCSFDDGSIFAGTVLENILVGRKGISEQDVSEACQRTGLFDHLAMLPEGLLTKLDPQASRLPRSLVKRISLTRCIVGRPRLVLLEDNMRDQDRHDREQVLGWITAPERSWTVLAVSNDPWLQERCGRVVHLHKGRTITD